MTSIYLPSTFVNPYYKYAYPLSGLNNLEKIIVDPANPQCCSIDGVLFSKEGNGLELMLYPSKRPGSAYQIPEGVTSVRVTAIRKTLDTLILPESMTVPDFGYKEVETNYFIAHNLYYQGTIEQLKKNGNSMSLWSDFETIHCTDGTLRLDSDTGTWILVEV